MCVVRIELDAVLFRVELRVRRESLDPRPLRRVQLEPLKEGFLRINLRFGFMQDPDVPRALKNVEIEGRKFDMMDTTFFLGRETLIAKGTLGMPVWREKLFVLMSRNATSAMEFFRLPPNRVIELGAQIEL